MGGEGPCGSSGDGGSSNCGGLGVFEPCLGISGDSELLASTHSSSWSSSPIENCARPLDGTLRELPFRELDPSWDFAAPATLPADPLRFKEFVDEFFSIDTFDPVLGRLTLELLRFICVGVGLDGGVCEGVLICCLDGACSSVVCTAVNLDNLLRFLP